MTRFLACFLLTLASSAALFAASPRELIEQILSPDAVLANARALGLSGEQEQRLRQTIAPLQHAMGPAQRRMRTLNDQLVALLSPPQPDEAAVLAKFAELEAAESEVKSLRLRMTLAAKAVLTPEQQQQAATVDAPRAAAARNGDDSTIRGKLQRVRDGIDRWQREGRDVSQVRALWSEFQKRAELHHHQLAMKALNEALELLEASTEPPRN